MRNKINKVKIGRKTYEQEKVITNLENFYQSREEVFNFFRDYAKIMLDSTYKAKQDETKETGLKILTPKQMFQRFLIAFAQVKAGNISENLLNEIRQLLFLCIDQKKSTKKYIIHNQIYPITCLKRQ